MCVGEEKGLYLLYIIYTSFLFYIMMYAYQIRTLRIIFFYNYDRNRFPKKYDYHMITKKEL